jgi:hypothetical protein
MLNKGFTVGLGGLDQAPPCKSTAAPVPQQHTAAFAGVSESTAADFHLGWFGETSLPLLLASGPNGSSNGSPQVYYELFRDTTTANSSQVIMLMLANEDGLKRSILSTPIESSTVECT